MSSSGCLRARQLLYLVAFLARWQLSLSCAALLAVDYYRYFLYMRLTMTFLTTPVVNFSHMRKLWIPGPLPSQVGPGDEARVIPTALVGYEPEK